MLYLKSCIWLTIIFILVSCKSGQATMAPNSTGASLEPSPVAAAERVTNYTYEIINTYPHDRTAFTQGLVYHQGVLYESTGLNGRSSLRKVELQTGKVLKEIEVPSEFFAEGLALSNGRAYQLTWQSEVCFVYDLESFKLLNTFSYEGEGWGLATDGSSLIMSDGSDKIRFMNPENFQVQRTITVADGSRHLTNLNELEYIQGQILANIWQTDRIVKIDPQTGKVIAWINLSGLLPPLENSDPGAVLNGIAYDPAGDRLFVTGKLWPKLFEIKLKPRRLDITRQ